ncbi:MAG: hypothetical protein HS111_25150 [Kofleriaceae bacterium]|nr:hypothetical protein [Kofleriaceae bacterium]
MGSTRTERRVVADDLVDKRWRWIPWWASNSGLHKLRPEVTCRGKNGSAPILEGCGPRAL